MGYWASGAGDIVLKKDIDLNEVKEIIEMHLGDIEIIKLEKDREGNDYIYVSDSSTHWDEEDIRGFLRDIEQYAEDGVLDYSGDEDAVWRYVFDEKNKKFVEENATIDYNFESYSDEELIKELEKRGYKVNR